DFALIIQEGVSICTRRTTSDATYRWVRVEATPDLWGLVRVLQDIMSSVTGRIECKSHEADVGKPEYGITLTPGTGKIWTSPPPSVVAAATVWSACSLVAFCFFSFFLP
ncbi:9754_t:CDS:2, partial [Acaulospora colombiana]